MIERFCVSQPPPTSKNRRWPGESEPVLVTTESGQSLLAYHKIWTDEPGDSAWYSVPGETKLDTGPGGIKYWCYVPKET